jgi:hypothetical protein
MCAQVALRHVAGSSAGDHQAGARSPFPGITVCVLTLRVAAIIAIATKHVAGTLQWDSHIDNGQLKKKYSN